MSNYRILLGLTLRNRLAGLRAGSWRKSDGKLDVARIIGTLIAVVGMGFLAGLMIFAEIKLFGGLAAVGQPMLLPALIVMMCMIGTLFFSFFHVMSSLYFSRDTAWMAYLPVRSRTVLAAKTTEIYLGEMAFCSLVLLPVLVLYGQHLQAGALYYVRMVMIILAVPMLPLTITLLLTTLLARLTALSRNKEAWIMIGTVALMACIVALELKVMPSIPDDADAMYFVKLILAREGLVTALTGAFPPVLWAVRGTAGNWMQFGAFILCSVCALTLCLMLLGGGYLTLCLRQSEQGSRRRAIRLTERSWRQRGPLMALFRRELMEVLKTPVYAFNSFAGAIMVPLILLGMNAGITANSEDNLKVMLGELLGGIAPSDMILLITALVAFAGFLDPAISTAVSREGRRHEISRMIPVTARMQITAKMMMGLCVNGITVLVAAAAVAAVMPPVAVWVIPAVLLSMLECFAISALTLTLDAVRPNLHWTSETQVIKQGANVAFGMLIGLAMYVLPVAAAVLLLRAAPIMRLTGVIVTLALECTAGFLLLRLVAEKRYAVLEDTVA